MITSSNSPATNRPLCHPDIQHLPRRRQPGPLMGERANRFILLHALAHVDHLPVTCHDLEGQPEGGRRLMDLKRDRPVSLILGICRSSVPQREIKVPQGPFRVHFDELLLVVARQSDSQRPSQGERTPELEERQVRSVAELARGAIAEFGARDSEEGRAVGVVFDGVVVGRVRVALGPDFEQSRVGRCALPGWRWGGEGVGGICCSCCFS